MTYAVNSNYYRLQESVYLQCFPHLDTQKICRSQRTTLWVIYHQQNAAYLEGLSYCFTSEMACFWI